MTLPSRFVWGAATSAYQIEGAADVDGRGASIWDTFCREPGRTVNGDTGDVAIDHYHRSAADVRLLADLGFRAYSFSISWSRVFPSGRGPLNQRGLDFYLRLVDDCLAAGLEPYPTLYHWDLPQALQDEGGWTNRATIDAFADYAAAVYEALHDRVETWATLNEPWCAAYLGHCAGIHAPGVQDEAAAVAAAHHQLVAHGAAIARMRSIRRDRALGIVLNPAPIVAVDPSDPVLVDAVRRVDGLMNRFFFDGLLRGEYPADLVHDLGPLLDVRHAEDAAVIAAPIDWLGINYYHDHRLGLADPAEHPPTPFPRTPATKLVADTPLVTDLGWPVTPYGLTDLLVRLRDEYPNLPPLYITENGAAFNDPLVDGRIDDKRRIEYYTAHIEAVSNAIDRGVDVRGFFAWSAFDNFEWHSGYGMRFGIVHVDYETLVRTPRASAHWFQNLIKQATGDADGR
jgi:beta-glucosidase